MGYDCIIRSKGPVKKQNKFLAAVTQKHHEKVNPDPLPVTSPELLLPEVNLGQVPGRKIRHCRVLSLAGTDPDNIMVPANHHHIAVNSLRINLRQCSKLLLELIMHYCCRSIRILLKVSDNKIAVGIKMMSLCPLHLCEPVVIFFRHTQYLLYCSEVDF